jgi:hypothetical protein
VTRRFNQIVSKSTHDVFFKIQAAATSLIPKVVKIAQAGKQKSQERNSGNRTAWKVCAGSRTTSANPTFALAGAEAGNAVGRNLFGRLRFGVS